MKQLPDIDRTQLQSRFGFAHHYSKTIETARSNKYKTGRGINQQQTAN